MNRSHGRVGPVVGTALVVLALAVAGSVWVVQARGPDGPLARAAGVVDDRDRWTTGSAAAEALGALADGFVAEADGCRPGTDSHDDRCRDLHQATAWAQVSALTALRCSRPHLAEVRTSASELVERLRTGDPLGDPPRVVKC